MNLVDWLPLLGTLVLATVTLFGMLRQRRKDDAETSEKISTAWEKLIQPYGVRITYLERSIQMMTARERILWDYINVLQTKLVENNIEVPPMPVMPTLPSMADVTDEDSKHG